MGMGIGGGLPMEARKYKAVPQEASGRQVHGTETILPIDTNGAPTNWKPPSSEAAPQKFLRNGRGGRWGSLTNE